MGYTGPLPDYLDADEPMEDTKIGTEEVLKKTAHPKKRSPPPQASQTCGPGQMVPARGH